MAEVENISGGPRQLRSNSIKINPRYVNEKCTGCGKCAEASEMDKIDNPFNFGMNKVKGAYLPHEFAFPARYVIAPEAVKAEGKKLEDACAYGAVELDQQPKTMTLNVGSIVWAAGWTPYRRLQDRLLWFRPLSQRHHQHDDGASRFPTGPTCGKIRRPSDGKEPKNMAFIQCAGSRDENYLAYCSGVCCLASLKQSTYVLEQYPDAKVTIYFIDIRARGRYEDFYQKLQQNENISFIKSKIALINEDEASGDLLLEGENTMTGEKMVQRARHGRSGHGHGSQYRGNENTGRGVL